MASWQRQGRVEGHEEGLAEGREEVARAIALQIAANALARSMRRRRAGSTHSLPSLDVLVTALLDFTGVADLKAWLDAQLTDPPHNGTPA